MEKTQTGFTEVLTDNKERMGAIETYKNAPISRKAQMVTFGGLAIGGTVLASIFALQIISGMVALVAIGVVGVVGVFGIRALRQADPLIQQKLKNKILEAMYNEASKNAIIQLSNQVIINEQKLSNARKSRDKMGAMVKNLESKVATSSESNKPKMQKTLDALSAAYQSTIISVDRAQVSIKEFETKVNDFRELDRFNKEAGAVLAMFESSGNDKLNEMLSLESFSSIETEFNTAITSIENSAHDAELDSK